MTEQETKELLSRARQYVSDSNVPEFGGLPYSARLISDLIACVESLSTKPCYSKPDADHRIRNLRAIYADESVNHFARAICNEAAQHLESLSKREEAARKTQTD